MPELSPLCGPIETQTLSPGHGDSAGTGLVTGCAPKQPEHIVPDLFCTRSFLWPGCEAGGDIEILSLLLFPRVKNHC